MTDDAEQPRGVLEMRGVCFDYAAGGSLIDGFDLSIASGDTVALMGRSGSGKSTLLHLMVGLLTPTAGVIRIEDADITTLSRDQRADVRLSRCGFVLQFGELIPELTVGENIALPLQLLGVSPRHARARAAQRAEQLGIADLFPRRLWQVSGGEMQRAAIARSVVHDPAIVFADEPTGALDRENAETVMQTLMELRAEGLAVVVVTHDPDVASSCDRVVSVGDVARRRVPAHMA